MSQWNYFVTAQPATAVTHAVGPLRLTSSEPADLVVARGTSLEVLRLSPTGGSPCSVCRLPVRGRVWGLEALRPEGAERELLLLLTERRQVVVLRFAAADVAGTGHPVAGDLVAVAVGSLQGPPGRQPVDHEALLACDPGGRAAAAYMYEGLLQVVALGAAAEGVDLGSCAFATEDARLPVVGLAFLHSARPLLATLQRDSWDRSSVRLWSPDLARRTVAPADARGGGRAVPAQAGAERLVAVPPPHGGFLVLGGSLASYYDGAGQRAAEAPGGPRSVEAAAGRADAGGLKWLVAGQGGRLWLLRLGAAARGSSSSSSSAPASPQPLVLSFEELGLVSPPRALAWLSDDHAFVGSAMGDSQFLCLSASSMDGNRFSVEDSWTNLGPIVDFCLADVDDRGQNQVVTCSGMNHTGALHLLRIGVGVNEAGSIDGFEGVLGLWALPGVGGGALAASFACGTRVLALQPGGVELQEMPAQGFSCGEESLLCCEAEGLAVQVTRTGVQLASLGTLAAAARWAPPEGRRVQVAAAAPGGVVLALGGAGGEVLLLRARAGGAEVACSWHLGAEVACLTARGGLCAAGLWSRELRVMPLRSGAEPLGPWPLPGAAVPRSAAFARLGGQLRLFVGLGDGVVAVWEVEEASGALGPRSAVRLGAQPVRLLAFGARGAGDEEHVFATGDRPTIVHASSSTAGQLAYATVNLRHVGHVAPFDVAPFAGCLAFVAEQRLMVGSFDAIQRVHVRTAPLGETPLRIAYHKGSDTFAVGCHPEEERHLRSCRRPPAVGSLRFVGARSLETVQVVGLAPHEMVCALCSASLGGDAAEFVAVGTTTVEPEEPEPKTGRVLLYAPQQQAWAEGSQSASFILAAELEVSGAVYALVPFQGMLLGSVTNRVVVWRRCPEEPRRLQEVCSYSASLTTLHLSAIGNLVMVGDLMQSASLLQYRPESPALEEVARDLGTSWLTAAQLLREDLIICADDSHNFFTLARGTAIPEPPPPNRPRTPHRSAGLPDLPKPHSKLERVGQMHSGEFVNRLRSGALARPVAGAEGSGAEPLEQVVWASVDGAVGLVASLSSEQEFARLSLIQDAVSREAPAVGGLPHGDWRNFVAEPGEPQPHRGFVDGDLLESLLELPRGKQQAVADRLAAQGLAVEGVEGLLREVEQLARLH